MNNTGMNTEMTNYNITTSEFINLIRICDDTYGKTPTVSKQKAKRLLEDSGNELPKMGWETPCFSYRNERNQLRVLVIQNKSGTFSIEAYNRD